jgi:hypothetical protein
MQNVGRNDPCPCGSGKKYKQCCWEERVRTMRDEDVLEAHEMLMQLLDEPDVVAVCRQHARSALGSVGERFDAALLGELQSLRLVQDALVTHVVVDGEDGTSLSKTWARDLPRNARAGLRRAFEHFSQQGLVLYRASAAKVDGALMLEAIDPIGAETVAVRISDGMDIEPGALVFGRSLYQDLDLCRHHLAFPKGVDEERIVDLARKNSHGPQRFVSLFQAWIEAWAPHIEKGGLASCFSRTLWSVVYDFADGPALIERLGSVPTAAAIDLGQFDEDEGEDFGDDPQESLHVIAVPDDERGHFDADFVVLPDSARAVVENEEDVAPLRAYIEPYLEGAASFELAEPRRELEFTQVTIEFVSATEQRTPGTVRVRATLDGIEPAIWRELDVPLAATLADLHDALVEAFGWDDLHEHEFETSIGNFAIPSGEMNPRVGDSTVLPVAQVLTTAGESLVWRYDFGDGWTTRVEALTFDRAADPRFKLVAGARACPPDDCGGTWGYSELVEAMRDRKHPRRAELLEWLEEEPFDPEAFDLAEHARYVDELN